MQSSLESLLPQGAKAVLLSIRPRFADQILAGTKRVEFRRAWAKEPVKLVVIYSSSPIQRIVGMVEVDGVVEASSKTVWAHCRSRGPGLARKELMDYFAGKPTVFGVLLGRLARPPKPIVPKSVIRGFRAPQSFRYLTDGELARLADRFLPDEKSA